MTDDLQLLVKALKTLDDRLVTCMRCGMCQAVCPVYGATLLEGDVTRGKIALLNNLAHELIDDPADVNDKLRRCLLCGSCEAQCPSGVKIMDIFLDARQIVTSYLGLSPVKRLIFRTLLPNPGLFGALMRLAGSMQGLVVRPEGNAQGTVVAPLLAPLLGERHMPGSWGRASCC